MKIGPVVVLAIVGVLADAQQQSPVAQAPTSTADHTAVSAQMRAIADVLTGTWSITWMDAKGDVIGSGQEVWKFAPGDSAFIEENRSKVNGTSTEEYAAMWWDGKARKIRGIWCDPTMNDEGCSQFEVTLEGKDVVFTGEWEYQAKRQAWREVFSGAAAAMTQTLYIGDPGTELKLASTIRAVKP